MKIIISPAKKMNEDTDSLAWRDLPQFLPRTQVLLDQLKGAFSFIKRHYTVINRICGGLLVLIGVLMATGVLNTLLRSLS